MADKTKMQEDGSKWIFLRALRDDVDYENLTPASEFVNKKTQDIILSSFKNPKQPNAKLDVAYNILLDKKIEELEKIFGGKLDDAWIKSYYYQTKALLKKYSKQNFKQLQIDRDSPGGFMEFITDLVKPLGVTKKDAWNPADIWIEDKQKTPKDPIDTLKKIVEFGRNETPTDRKLQLIKLRQVNALLRDFYRKEKVIGISLKKAGKNAEYIPVNVGVDENEIESEFKKIENMICEIVNVKCPLTLAKMKDVYGPAFAEKSSKMKSLFKNKGNEIYAKNYPSVENAYCFSTQDTTITIFDSQSETTYFLTIKATQTSEYSNLKYEPTEKGKGSAKLGKAPVEMVADIITKYNLKFDNNNRKYPLIYDESYVKNITLPSLKVAANKAGLTGQQLYTGITSPEQFKQNLKACYACDPVTAQSKLMQLDFLISILSLDKQQLSKLVTDIVYVAKKEGRAFGPFGKIY
jgi:hypothetical protein